MSDDNNLAKILKVVKFDGSSAKWSSWLEKFKVITKHCGHSGVLVGRDTVAAENVTLDPTDSREKSWLLAAMRMTMATAISFYAVKE